MLAVHVWPLESFMDVVSALGGLLVTISALVIFIMAWIEKLSDEEVRSSDDVSSTDWPS